MINLSELNYKKLFEDNELEKQKPISKLRTKKEVAHCVYAKKA